MTKQEYISKLTNLIINRVTFHAPKLKCEVDFSLLDAIGINGEYPVFVFNKKLDSIFYKAFLEAKKSVEFNLILTEKPLISKKKLEKLNKTYIIFQDEIGSLLASTLEGLNINYVTHSQFKKEFKKEYLSLNGKEVSFDYLPYFYTKKIMQDGVISDVKSYILNGKNYNLSFVNTKDEERILNFEFNLPLPRGYYIFNQKEDCVEIKNLTNNSVAYFNNNFKGGKFSFSSMDGIESSTFACINIKCKINLFPKESRKIYFNYGERKYCLNSPKEMQYFFDLSQNKMNEIFDIKVNSRDNNFDNDFNLSLPRKIWEKWQNFDIDEESENVYLKMRNKIIQSQSNGYQISQDFKGLKEVIFFRNQGWKRVFIVHNHSCYMYADKIKYFNFTLLTKEIFDKNNEIYLSFAQ